ncbi:MAG TPA: DUF2336 domain-containing protein [Rhodoblastus sp.]|nr:DUF2336 domain-containing protein [Rhodoblastus sp.]
MCNTMDETLRKRLESLTATGRAQSLDFEGVAARVATDRFVTIARPDAAACARYEELMISALDHVDDSAAQRIAQRLAPCPAAPAAVLARLIACGPESAATVLARAPDLPATLLLERATDGDVREAVAIAQREDLDAATTGALARRLEPEALHGLAANRTISLDRGALIALTQRARVDLDLGRLLLARDDHALDRTVLFLSADAAARRRILLDAARGSLAARDYLPAGFDAARRDAFGAAECGDLPRFCSILARAIRVSRAAIERLARDAGGEPLGLIFATSGFSATECEPAIIALRPDLAAALADPMSGLRFALQAPPRAASALLASLLPGRQRRATTEYDGSIDSAPAWQGKPKLDTGGVTRTIRRA